MKAPTLGRAGCPETGTGNGIKAENYGLGQGEEAESEMKLAELVAETMVAWQADVVKLFQAVVGNSLKQWGHVGMCQVGSVLQGYLDLQTELADHSPSGFGLLV